MRPRTDRQARLKPLPSTAPGHERRATSRQWRSREGLSRVAREEGGLICRQKGRVGQGRVGQRTRLQGLMTTSWGTRCHTERCGKAGVRESRNPRSPVQAVSRGQASGVVDSTARREPFPGPHDLERGGLVLPPARHLAGGLASPSWMMRSAAPATRCCTRL